MKLSINRRLNKIWNSAEFKIICLIFSILSAINFSGCTAGLINSTGSKYIVTTTTPTPSSTTTAQDSYTISNVNVSISGTTTNTTSVVNGVTVTLTSTPATAKIQFNTSTSNTNLLTHCNVATNANAQTSKPCLCKFSWNQINPNTRTTAAVSRGVQTTITAVQPYSLSCAAPEVYATSEIPSSTQIQVTIIPGPQNPDFGLFTFNTFTFTKSATVATGSFQDSQGHIFDNVLHYSCYDKLQRGLTIQSKVKVITSTQTQVTKNAYYATQFCLNTYGQSTTPNATDCPTLPPSDYTAQSSYYNLYIRASEQGDINQSNNSFSCPLVQEALRSLNTVGTQNQAWPLDATFALSLAPTTNFPVGIEAFTKLSNSNDPTAVNSTCYASADGNANTTTSSGVISSCLGFAAKPNTNGTCPTFTDSSGLIRQTFRLRRYMALYPRLFDTNGSPISNLAQGLDTIYVLDRPVKPPVSANALTTYTMRGPKPCPFAFFDRKNVTGLNIGYVGTNNSAWNGKNIDGIEFPNLDGQASDGSMSCSAALPKLNSDRNFFSIVTVNQFQPNASPTGVPAKHVYIRPFQSFSPHYEEDTSFFACAPQAYPLQDAPLHFSRDTNTGNVSWCSESYPTQNNNITVLDPPAPTIPSGIVSPFTSHVVKNSASAACHSTPVNMTSSYSAVYPRPAGASSGYADHSASTTWDTSRANVTCDRTVTSTGVTWARFPLLSPSGDLENAIKVDSSYQCAVTYDNFGNKTNKTTPSDGCCDRNTVRVVTGSSGANSAHLEPDISCGTPNY